MSGYESSLTLLLSAVTLPRYTPDAYHMPEQNSGRVTRNPTIRISRATRAVQSNASLEREITDPNELRNLDEFLGNQVRKEAQQFTFCIVHVQC